jgi:6-phosphofructokinase 1
VRLADVPFGAVLRDALRTRLAELGLATTIVAKDIGYELRCAKPVAFDVEYTRALGYGAVRYLLGGGSGALIAQTGGEITPLTLADLLDPATGRIRVRRVDVRSTSYAIARAYMTQLEPGDLTEPRLAQISAATSLAPAEFAAHFARVVRAFAPA